jgi:hypothetical protein
MDKAARNVQCERPARPIAPRRLWRAALTIRITALSIAVALLAGCSEDEDPLADALANAGQAPVTTPAPTPDDTSEGDPDAAVDSDERVLADYLKYWKDVAAASSSTGDPSSRLDDHAIQPQFGSALSQIQRARAAGQIARGEPRLLDSTVVERKDGTATVGDCMDSRDWQYYHTATGKPVGTPSGKRYAVTAKLRLVDSVWKVSILEVKEDRCG